jgi:hypothetical protein
MILEKVTLKVTVKVIEMVTGTHAISVSVMFHVTVPLTVTFLSITCKINQEQYLARFSKVQVWQNRARFNLALTCDFVILVNLTLSCQGISLYLAKQIS